jgi:AcrR family transcriptional regulator
MWYMPVQAKPAGPRARLLDAAVEHALQHGVAEISLRQLAAAIGTSHRMLLHHFGSREALLVEVIKVVEARQRAVMDEELDRAGSATEAARRHWRQLRDPSLWPQERLFFEVYGQALRGQPWATPMLEDVVDAWVETFAARLIEAGSAPAAARTAARLGLAVTRGLLLDLLATGEVDEVDDAMELFVSLVSR